MCQCETGISPWARLSYRDCPAQLVSHVFAQGSNRAFRVDNVPRQRDHVSALSNSTTELIVVGAVRGECLETADLAQSLARRRHRCAKGKPQALELPRRQDARGEIGG